MRPTLNSPAQRPEAVAGAIIYSPFPSLFNICPVWMQGSALHFVCPIPISTCVLDLGALAQAAGVARCSEPNADAGKLGILHTPREYILVYQDWNNRDD